MARLTLKGVIKHIGTTQSFGSNGFRKRDIVVVEDGTKFPNPVKFTLKKDYCELADNFHEGDTVTISASVNGREWTNPKNNQVSYFIDLDAYKIEDGDGSAEAKPAGSSKKSTRAPAPVAADELPYDAGAMDDGDIPF